MSGHNLQVGFPFSFANYDPEAVAQLANDQLLDELILLACLPIACSELVTGMPQKQETNPTVMELRRKLLPLVCHKQAKSRFQTGQSMSSIFLWFDQLLAKEEKMALEYATQPSDGWLKMVFAELISSLVEAPKLDPLIPNNSPFAYSTSAHLAHYFYSQLYLDVQLTKKTYEQEKTTGNSTEKSCAALIEYSEMLEMAFEKCRLANPIDKGAFGDQKTEVENTILPLDGSQTAVLVAVREGMPVRDAILTFSKLVYVQAFCLAQKAITQQSTWLEAENDLMELCDQQASSSASQVIADCVVSGMAVDEATSTAASMLAPPSDYTLSQAEKKALVET
uniref:BRO1 domain-containing protein n=1 Tax=Ditylenchus dipsaci TaxID=166011 RepID=A0A915E9S7_9BILA